MPPCLMSSAFIPGYAYHSAHLRRVCSGFIGDAKTNPDSTDAQATFLHLFIDALALFLVDIPVTFLTTTVWGIILYFLVGLQTSAGQFFIYYLFLFVTTITMKSWFRALAAAFPAEGEPRMPIERRLAI